jgi:hypothetical protein
LVPLIFIAKARQRDFSSSQPRIEPVTLLKIFAFSLENWMLLQELGARRNIYAFLSRKMRFYWLSFYINIGPIPKSPVPFSMSLQISAH